MLNNSNIEMDYGKVTSTPIVMSLSPDCYILSYTNNAEKFFSLSGNINLNDQNLFEFIHKDDIAKCEKLIDSLSEGVTFEIDCKFNLNDVTLNNKAVVFQMPRKYSKVMNEIIWVTIPGQTDSFSEESLITSRKYNFAVVSNNKSFLFNYELTQLLGIKDTENIVDIVFDQSRRRIDFDKLLSSLKEGDILTENLYLRNDRGQYLPFSGIIVKHDAEYNDSLIMVLSEGTAGSKNFLEYTGTDISELQEKLQSRDKFFSVIAHDLRSPFTAILGYSEYMASYYENLTREEIHDFSNNMYKASKSVFKLLEDLLKWTRIQSGKISLDKEVFLLAPLLNKIVEMFKTMAESKKIRLIYNPPEEKILINADREMISSVFRNLVSNGIKFTEPNGFVKIDIKVEDGFVIVSVIDNGIGIDKVTLSKLFKVGERVTRYGTNDEEGSGLGLILSKEFIQKNGGDIWVESQVGEGSKFHVKLPLAD